MNHDGQLNKVIDVKVWLPKTGGARLILLWGYDFLVFEASRLEDVTLANHQWLKL